LHIIIHLINLYGIKRGRDSRVGHIVRSHAMPFDDPLVGIHILPETKGKSYSRVKQFTNIGGNPNQ